MKYILLIAFTVLALQGPAQALHPDLPPASLSRHPVKMAHVNDLDYYYIEQGTGPTIFFLHGFPDMAGTWDDAIDSLSTQFHCVAPFLRGYYPTGIPADGDYGSKTIATDIGQLAEEMGLDSFYVVGQDWGASITYSLVNLYPERVKKAVAIAVPHATAIKITPRLAYKARHFLKFRNEHKSPAQVKKDNFHYLDLLFERWSPGWTDYRETSELVKKTYALEGRTEAALGYYWSLNRNSKDEELSAFYNQLPQVPMLVMAGKNDGALTMKPFHEMQKLMPEGFQLLIYENAGHFLHREVPEDFMRELRGFLGE